MAASIIDGFGAVTWWGFSPALDLGDLKQKGKMQLDLVLFLAC